MLRLSSATAILAVSAVTLTACGDSLTNAQRGAIIGGLAGAAVGNSADSNEPRGAILGAVAGAAVGAAAGNFLDQQEAKLQEDLAGSGIDIDNQGDQLVLTGDSSAIEFAFDSAALSASSRAQIATIADTLVQFPQSRVEVVGHTDSVGSAEYNQSLSERRALAVVDVLEANGVTGQRLSAFAAGENEPVASNDTDAGRAMNRRVEIAIIPTG
jgi:outer membrane protein OmpA-like peptidoglycan-associated protein